MPRRTGSLQPGGRGQQGAGQESGELVAVCREHQRSAPSILQTVPCAHEAQVPALGKGQGSGQQRPSSQSCSQWVLILGTRRASQVTEVGLRGRHGGQAGGSPELPGLGTQEQWSAVRIPPARPPLVSDRGLGRMARGSMVGGPGSLHTDFPSVAFVSSLWGRNICFTTSPRSFRKWGPLDAAGGGCSLCSLVTRLHGTPGALAFSTLALRQMCKYADTSVCPTRVASPRVHCWPGSGQVLRGAGLPHVLCAPDV